MSKYGRPPPKYYALANMTLLRFDVREFAHTYVYMQKHNTNGMAKSGDTIQIGWEGWMAMELRALRVPRKSRVNATAIAMSSYSVVRHVCHGASSRRDRELKYSSQPIAKNQATMTPKVWISTRDSSLCGHLRRSSL